MHIQLCKVRKKNGAEKKIWAEKKNGPKRPTNLAETTQLQNWAETTQAETTRPKRLRTETTQGPKRFRAETSRYRLVVAKILQESLSASWNFSSAHWLHHPLTVKISNFNS